MAKILVISNYKDFHSTRPEAFLFVGLAKSHDVHVISGKNNAHRGAFLKAGVHVEDFHPPKKKDKIAIKKIQDYVKTRQIKIVFLFNSEAISCGLSALKHSKVKIILYRGFAGHLSWYDPSAYLKHLHPRVDLIWCNSFGVEEYLKKQMVFVNNKTITINKGHDVLWYENTDPFDIRKEIGVADDAFLFITVANNRKMKGVVYLLNALRFLKDVDYHLVLVGKNMDTPKNKALIKKIGADKNVHFLGFRENALAIVKSADCFVLPSIYGESITKSVIEAMSLKIPCVITDIPGNVELIDHKENGIVVPSKNPEALAEGLSCILNNKNLRKDYANKGYLKIKRVLNQENAIKKLNALITHISPSDQ